MYKISLVLFTLLLFVNCNGNNQKKVSDSNKSNPPTNSKIAKQPKNCSILLKNTNFKNNIKDWEVTGSYQIIQSSIKLNNASLSQIADISNKDIDTYQLEGYYKLEKDANLEIQMQFLDKDKNLIFKRDALFINKTDNFKPFLLNATATPNTKFIKVVIDETSQNTNGATLKNFQIKSSTCYDYTIASSLPPKGLNPKNVPQFVVLGFDDNTKSEGINWVLDLYKKLKNRDKTPIKTSFYINTIGLKNYIEDEPIKLQNALKRAANEGHEIGNHTDNHNPRKQNETQEQFDARINHLSYNEWKTRIQNANNDILKYLNIKQSNIQGFRTPYLMYNKNSFKVIKDLNFQYDCSIEDGYAPEMNGTNFRWPYQLNGGSAGLYESWKGKDENKKHIDIGKIDGLWELPSYPLMVPKDNECEKYGIKKGLWNRLVNRVPYLKDQNYKITGLDYNLWHEMALNKDEVLGILKYNLDLRLSGNHAPFMIGTHTQFYTKSWADLNAPNANYLEMRESIEKFLKYALSKDKVIVTRSKDVLKWCKNPKYFSTK